MSLSTLPDENKFQTQRYLANDKGFFNKLIDSRSLFEAFPKMKYFKEIEPSVRRIASYSKQGMLSNGSTMYDHFKGKAKMMYSSENYFKHKLYVEGNDLRATIVKVYDAPTVKLGKGHTEFSIGLDAEFYGSRDQIAIDGLMHAPLYVIDMQPDGGGIWKYTFKLSDSDDLAFITTKMFRVGDKVTQLASLRGEAAIERGNVAIGMDNSYIEYTIPATKTGWSMKVTDDAWLGMDKFRITPKDANWIDDKGNNQPITVNMLELKFMQATDKMIDFQLLYGRSSKQWAGLFLDGMTHRPINAGPMFFEWMEGANEAFYSITGGSLNFLKNLFSRMWDNTVEIEDRGVDVYTGQLGIDVFERWCIKAEKPHILPTEDLNIKRTKGYDSKHIGTMIGRRQYTGTFVNPFGEIRVHYMKFLDDKRIETRLYNGHSIRGAEMLVFDYGLGKGDEANIYINQDITGTNGFGYGLGLYSPIGPVFRNPSIASRYPSTLGSENAYEMIRDEKFTMIMRDPKCLIHIKPAFR